MGALLDLWKSERGLVAVALIAAATTLCGFGTISVEQWLEYTKWIFVTYAAAKTVTGAVGIATKGTSAPGTDLWQQLKPLLDSVLANVAAERATRTAAATSASDVAPSPTQPPPISIVPPPPKAG